MTPRCLHPFALLAAIVFAPVALGQNGSGARVAELEQRLAELEVRDASNQALIAELQDRLRTLETGGRIWVTEQRAEHVRAIVDDLLADVDRRTSLLGDGATAGWDKGFFLADADGAFRLRLLGQIQYRYVLSHNNSSSSNETQHGFDLTRARVGFKGHVIDPSWQYFIWGGWNVSGSSLLLDAWVCKILGNGWALQAGQFKTEAWREWTVSETCLQFVERSLLDARYGVSYTQGIALQHRADDLRINLQLHDGMQTRATAWNVTPGPPTALYQVSNEFAVGARGEWKLAGQWVDYKDWEGWPDAEPLVVIGGSLYLQKGESGTADREIDLRQYSIDATLKCDGANLFAAIIGTSVEDGAAQDRVEMGVLIQGGVMVADDLELMARYEWGNLDGAGTASDDLSILTVGFSKYWNRHALKWTSDLGYAFDPVDAAWGGAGRGWRPDAAGEHGQIVLRSQINLVF